MIEPSRRESDLNKDVVRNVEEAWSRGDVDALAPFFSPDFKSHSGVLGLPPGIEGFRIIAEGVAKSFPDRKNTIEDVVAEGDRVAVRIRSTGTNVGGIEMWGLEGNGRRFDFQWMSIYRFAEGRIVEHWGLTDVYTLAHQVGALGASSDNPQNPRK